MAATLVLPTVAQATTWTVNTTADNTQTGSECSGAPGDCSIRQAAAKAKSGDTISIPANALGYVVAVANGFIVIPGGVTVTGAGAGSTTVSGQGSNQIFEVVSAGTTTFENLTLEDAKNSTGDEAGAITANQGGNPTIVVNGVVFSNDVTQSFGGAIEQNGTGSLTVQNSRFVNDQASAGGGAIDFNGNGAISITNTVFSGDTAAGAGAVLIENLPAASTIGASTFSGNTATGAQGGGAIRAQTAHGVTISNSTFTSNSASAGVGGGILGTGSETLVNDTISGNTAPTGANIDSSGTLNLQNTIIAKPAGGGANCAGTITTQGNNLEDTKPSTCGLSALMGDLIGVDPQLASALADNGSLASTAGGPPQTLALASTSPALAKASAVGCGSVAGVDERGLPRPDPGESACDIGAFEAQEVATTTSLSSSASSITAGHAVTFSAHVAPGIAVPSGYPGPSGTVTFKDGATTLATVPLNGAGNASYTTSGLAVGSHEITTSYSGDLNYVSSASGALTETVSPVLVPSVLVPPVLSNLRVSPSKFSLAGRKVNGHCVKPTGKNSHDPRCRRAIRLRVTYSLSTSATVTFTLKRQAPGRKVNGRCVKPTKKNRKHAKCTRLSSLHGHIVQSGTIGANHFTFNGKIGGHQLSAGVYELIATSTSGTSNPVTFKIVR